MQLNKNLYDLSEVAAMKFSVKKVYEKKTDTLKNVGKLTVKNLQCSVFTVNFV